MEEERGIVLPGPSDVLQVQGNLPLPSASPTLPSYNGNEMEAIRTSRGMSHFPSVHIVERIGT